MFKLKHIILFAIVSIGLFLYFKPFSSTKITILNHLSSYNRDSTIVQICLVENPPLNSKKLKEFIEVFNKKNKVKKDDFRRTFYKQSDKNIFSFLLFDPPVNYLSKSTKRSDLDNINMLATSRSFLNYESKRKIETTVNVGELWYYKK